VYAITALGTSAPFLVYCKVLAGTAFTLVLNLDTSEFVLLASIPYRSQQFVYELIPIYSPQSSFVFSSDSFRAHP
jgi:hypothetical protein